MPSSRPKIHALIVVVAALAAEACAPTRPPVDELNAAARGLEAARAADAPTWAAEDYRVAERHLREAQAAQARGDYDVAAQSAREAAADSELASVRARLGKTRDAVARLKQENATMNSDLSAGAHEEQP